MTAIENPAINLTTTETATETRSWADEGFDVYTCDLPDEAMQAMFKVYVESPPMEAAALCLLTHAAAAEVLAKLAARPIDQDRVHTIATPSFTPTENKDEREALFEKQRNLLSSFVQHELSVIRQQPVNTVNLVGNFWIPNDKARRSFPERAYWAGPGGDVRRAGTPIVQLLQGVRDHMTGIVYPERLPGGRTAIQLIQEVLDQERPGNRVSMHLCRNGQVFLYEYPPTHPDWRYTQRVMESYGVTQVSP